MSIIFGYLYLACFTVCYVPQIYNIYKHKNVEGLSITMFAISIIGYIAFLTDLIIRNTAAIPYVLNCIIGVVCCTIIIANIIRLRR